MTRHDCSAARKEKYRDGAVGEHGVQHAVEIDLEDLARLLGAFAGEAPAAQDARIGDHHLGHPLLRQAAVARSDDAGGRPGVRDRLRGPHRR